MSIQGQMAKAIAGTMIAGLSVFGTVRPGLAQTFNQQEISDPSKFEIVASPVGNGSSHQLLLIEQLTDKRPCWSESGSNPTIVNPLLLTFDFTGICNRTLDSNGYSIRMAGQDWGLTYSLSLVHTANDIVLVGRNPLRRQDPVVQIGHTGGITNDFAKITLYPGWRLTRRTYEGKVLGHIYLTNDRSLAEVAGAAPVAVTPTPTPTPTPIPTPTPTPTPVPTGKLTDITTDIYRNEIEQAVTLGFVGGFPDGTFHPTEAITREQLVSLVLEALKRLPTGAFPVPTQISTAPYSDVPANRWSAAKIQYARDTGLIKGYPDGTFKPLQAVSRAELIAVMHQTALYGQLIQRQGNNLLVNQTPLSFTDTQGHWAQSIISQMSAYCRVASPYGEQGQQFLPNTAAQRNYAAAATLRLLQCLSAKRS